MEVESTWKEMERRMSKSGFREGAAEGYASTFTNASDDGFQEGLRAGLILGYNQGLSAIDFPTTSKGAFSKSNCQICENANLLHGDYKKIKEAQSMATLVLETNLKLNLNDELPIANNTKKN